MTMTRDDIATVDRQISDRATTFEGYQAEITRLLGRPVSVEDVWEWLLESGEDDEDGYGHGV